MHGQGRFLQSWPYARQRNFLQAILERSHAEQEVVDTVAHTASVRALSTAVLLVL